MKTINDKNQIWFQTEEGVTKIGFTKPFLDSLDQCWHILPANTRQFKRKAPMLIVETNDALISIASPIDGSLMQHEQDAINFPDHLTEESVVMTLSSKPVAKIAEPQPQVVHVDGRLDRAIDWANVDIQWNPENLMAPPPPRQDPPRQEVVPDAVQRARERIRAHQQQRAVQDDLEQF